MCGQRGDGTRRDRAARGRAEGLRARGAGRGAVSTLPLSSGPPPTLRLLRGAPRVRARGRSCRLATRRAGQVGPLPPLSSRFLPGKRGWVGPAGRSAGWSAKPPFRRRPPVETRAWRGAGGGAKCLTAGWGREAGPGGRDGKSGLAQDLLVPDCCPPSMSGGPRAIPVGVSGSFVPRRPRRV